MKDNLTSLHNTVCVNVPQTSKLVTVKLVTSDHLQQVHDA